MDAETKCFLLPECQFAKVVADDVEDDLVLLVFGEARVALVVLLHVGLDLPPAARANGGLHLFVVLAVLLEGVDHRHMLVLRP